LSGADNKIKYITDVGKLMTQKSKTDKNVSLARKDDNKIIINENILYIILEHIVKEIYV